MNDCPNAEMRDLLPDLLHERLAANVRAEVTAHVSACADCREELELLRGLRDVMVTYTPRVNVAYVVNALPKPPSRGARPIVPRRTWADWRIAAAITVLAVGATSMAVVNRGERAHASDVAVVPVDTQVPRVIDSTRGNASQQVAVAVAPSQTKSSKTPVESAETASLSMGGHLSALDDDQLRSLIDDIEQMKAVPITEPEPVSLRVDPRPQPIPESR